MHLSDQKPLQQYKMSVQSNPESMADFLTPPSAQHSPQPLNCSSDPSQQKNGKWNQIQHAKYIVFMEYHRAQFKSKQQRRAHKFYKQMSAFIKTRNALQCRSHHQKLEDRYCYANKIILAFKHHGNMALYHSSLEELKNYEQGRSPKPSQDLQPAEQIVQVSSQTDINRVNIPFYFLSPKTQGSSQQWSSPPMFNGITAGQFLQNPMLQSCSGLYYSFCPNPYYINYL